MRWNPHSTASVIESDLIAELNIRDDRDTALRRAATEHCLGVTFEQPLAIRLSIRFASANVTG